MPQSLKPSRTAKDLPSGMTTALHPVARQCQSLLYASSYPSLRSLSCDFHEGVLSIRGTVSSFYLKQLAQAMIQKLEAADEINNQVFVQPDATPSRAAATGSNPPFVK